MQQGLGQKSAAYRTLIGALGLLARAFFREIEVVGADNVPRDRG
jgi:hypothetical protein